MRTVSIAFGTIGLLVVTASCARSSTGAEGAAPADGVVATLSAPASVKAGDSVDARVTLSNTSRDSVELQLSGVPGRPFFGIAITKANGDSVITIWNVEGGNRALSKLWVAPGALVTMSARLQLPSEASGILPPGSYLVRGFVSGLPVRESASLSIVVQGR